MLSVRATRSFFVMVDGVSVRRIRDLGFGADLDIFWVGRSRAMTRFAGAGGRSIYVLLARIDVFALKSNGALT